MIEVLIIGFDAIVWALALTTMLVIIVTMTATMLRQFDR